MKCTYEVWFKFQYTAGEPGWSYTIIDSNGRFRGYGWSRGKKRGAELEANAAIRRLQNRSAA